MPHTRTICAQLREATKAARAMISPTSAACTARNKPGRQGLKPGKLLKSSRAAPRGARSSAACARVACKRIEDVEIGDLVWAWNPLISRLETQPVARLFRRERQSVLRVVCLDSMREEHIIDVTTEHPFLVEERGWVPASELRPGDCLRTLFHRIRHGPTCVRNVFALSDEATVFNFEVATLHNYFVGSCGVLVHNQSVLTDASIAQTRVHTTLAARKLIREDVDLDDPHDARGACGLGQCAVALSLVKQGVDPSDIFIPTVQDVLNLDAGVHGFVVAQGRIVDHTFAQFRGNKMVLDSLSRPSSVASRMLKDGWIELSDDNATEYFSLILNQRASRVPSKGLVADKFRLSHNAHRLDFDPQEWPLFHAAFAEGLPAAVDAMIDTVPIRMNGYEVSASAAQSSRGRYVAQTKGPLDSASETSFEFEGSNLSFVALASPGNGRGRIVDIGSGTGAKALTMAYVHPTAIVDAFEASPTFDLMSRLLVKKNDRSGSASNRINVVGQHIESLQGADSMYDQVNIMAPNPWGSGGVRNPLMFAGDGLHDFGSVAQSAMRLVRPGGKLQLHTEFDVIHDHLLGMMQKSKWEVIQLRGVAAVKSYILGSNPDPSFNGLGHTGNEHYDYGLIGIRPF